MQTLHKVSILQNSVIIDEMYFKLDEIRFVDVTEQELPLFNRLCGIGGIFTSFIALVFIGFGIGSIAGPLFIIAIAQLTVRFTCKRRYALRIGQQLGTSKAIISPDREQLLGIRRQIMESLAQKTGQ